jgi:hypothetical protein
VVVEVGTVIVDVVSGTIDVTVVAVEGGAVELIVVSAATGIVVAEGLDATDPEQATAKSVRTVMKAPRITTRR